MHSYFKNFSVILYAIAFIVFPLVGTAKENDRSETYRLLELFGDVFERVRADYVEEVSDENLIEAAVRGMLTDLDPHSAYLNQKHFQDMKIQTKGEFGGLGIEVTMEAGYVKVVSPIDDTPAFRAGIKAGDLITHLDGDHVQGLTLSQAVEKMRGPIDSNIKLTVRRGTKSFDVPITRDKIVIRSVRSRTEGNIGYLRITSFSEQTESGINNAVDKIKNGLGDKLVGFVLDLRNNPGGLLDQAVMVSDAFLEEGEIVSTRGRVQENAQRFHASPGDVANGLPVVVLINGGSASASEIVAGALQDHRRAVILGKKSFGKGSVQTIIPLGRSGAIKLTTQRYFTPSGVSIQARGISPDIEVDQARIEPLEGTRRDRRHEADLRGALQNDQLEGPKQENDVDKKPGDAKVKVPLASKPVDYQLARALDLLRGLALYRNRIVN
ncbi:MAG: putative CtpA-like serine protease [Alphaproteobacteria bacterium MarineAlpha4_Bin2]|nr:MAG: putative CtpA-like serine protease [Alphaproteobacteria bacterium MarineAlpha4_Bin2]